MVNGRVIARSAGDTATGAFACVVRRAFAGDRVRYQIDVRNLAASSTDIAITRSGETLHEMLVPGRSRVTCSYVLPRSTAPLVINIVCDGTALAVQEYLGAPDADPAPDNVPHNERRLFFVSAAVAAAGVAQLAAAVWLVRRRRRPASSEPAAPALTEAHAFPPARIEPPASIEPFFAGAIEAVATGESALPANHASADEPAGASRDESSHVSADEPYAGSVDGPNDDSVDEPHGGSVVEPNDSPDQKPNSVMLLDPEPLRVMPLRRTSESWDARPRRRDPSFVAPVVGFTVACALIAGFVVAHPHVGDLGAPNTVLEGSAIDIPYTSSGIGSLRYRVASARGNVIASGPLADSSGVLHVDIPSVHHNEAYRVRVAMSGPFGDAATEATVGASALPVARVVTHMAVVPLIRSFAISRSTVNGAPVVLAFYDVIADAGTLRLIDSRGIQYQVTPLNPIGRTTLVLPAGVDPATLAVALHALRDGSAVDSRIALPAPGTNVAVASPPPDPNSLSAGASPIAVPDRAVGGAPIRVQIMHHYADLHVSLLDENARKIIGVDVPPGASSVILRHPPVSGTTRMTVEATYRVDKEADTIVRPVLIVPAGG